MRIMEDETYHETGQEYRNTSSGAAGSSPEGKLTARKLERHNETYGSSGSVTSRTTGSSHPFQNSLFPAASVLATARSNRLTSGHGHLVSSGRSDAGTQQSHASVAESVISRATARKGKF